MWVVRGAAEPLASAALPARSPAAPAGSTGGPKAGAGRLMRPRRGRRGGGGAGGVAVPRMLARAGPAWRTGSWSPVAVAEVVGTADPVAPALGAMVGGRAAPTARTATTLLTAAAARPRRRSAPAGPEFRAP